MALQKPVSKKEMVFAYNLLKRLGANLSNAYLITAVVAWLRVGAGYNMVNARGNNPLKMIIHGKLARFSSLTAAAYAAADAIKHARLGSAGGYDVIATIAKRSTQGHTAAEKDADAQSQAHDFLEAIALSNWDPMHYGTGRVIRRVGEYVGPTAASYQESRNSIAAIWYGIHGKLPKIVIGTTQPKQQRPPAPPPAPLQPPHGVPNYLDGHETARFYAASRPPTDLGNLPIV
jgi:hypothetical protein